MITKTRSFGFITECCGEFPVKESEDWNSMNGRCEKCGEMMPLVLDEITDKIEK